MQFSMCSLYPKDERAMCACFLGKDSSVVRDMKKLRSDALMWAAMVSGSISLHDLEQEAHGRRSWDGGRCDADFIKECEKEGIKVFGVVFTAQGYEVAIALDEKEGKLLSFGRKKEGAKNAVWGLNEFYNNRFQKIFKGWKDYFSDVLKDETGKPIKNFIEETACRNIKGEVIRALWTCELPKYFDMNSYYMCKNSPHWQRYIKKIIEMQIDAGVHGILFDETGAPFDWSMLGGGFCRHCMKKFESYMVEKYGKKFEGFNYAGFLKKRKCGLGATLKNLKGVPYWKDYRLWALESVRENLEELAEHARKYAKGKGKEVLITGNYAELLPYYFHVIDLVDIVNFEIMLSDPPEKNTALYRLARALARDKPVTAVPTIFNAADFRERKRKTDISNLEKYFIAEAAASQANYQIPYSCFTIAGKGAYYPDVDALEPYRSFIADNPELYGGKPMADVSLVCSFASYFWTFDWVNFPGSHMKAFFEAERILNDRHVQYDISILGDGVYLDEFYDTGSADIVILPNVEFLSDAQRKWLEDKEILIGKPDALIPSIKSNLPGASILAAYKKGERAMLHIVNAQYAEGGSFFPLRDVGIDLGKKIKSAELYTPEGIKEIHVSGSLLKIPAIPIYGVAVVEV